MHSQGYGEAFLEACALTNRGVGQVSLAQSSTVLACLKYILSRLMKNTNIEMSLVQWCANGNRRMVWRVLRARMVDPAG
jgi:hypothetical protein